MNHNSDASDPFSPTSNEVNPPDCILRSSDGVDFHVHKGVLAFESIFFRDLFSLPEPVGEDANLVRDGKPVVTLDESSQTVRKLLVLCYPRYASDELVSNLDGVVDAYVAADKYMVAGGQDLIEKLLTDPRILKKHPHRIYAIAIHRGMDTLVKIAAMETLKWPPHIPNLSIPEFRIISAQQLHRLKEFHHLCTVEMTNWIAALAATRDEEDPSDSEDRPDYVWWSEAGHVEGCGITVEVLGDPDEDSCLAVTTAKWFNEHMKRVQTILEKRPDAASISGVMCDFTTPLLASLAACPKCAEAAPRDLETEAKRVSRNVAQDQARVLATFSFND
ncbi:hypothetical protein C8J57DRAFT_1706257 [Mycena rebaudengoi]|nr:hypothetical protein C8J57DRAFT_1706257 [Mycena rebaudengoi]